MKVVTSDFLEKYPGFYKSLVILLVLFIFLYFYKLGGTSLLDVDEPRYPEVAREMLESNNWIVPHFNYEIRYDKPVLFYWLEALSMKIFGINEFASRFPSLFTALICVFFVFYFIKTFYNVLTGLLASLILMSCPEFAVLSRFSITDMTLSSFFSVSVISFFLGYNHIIASHRFFSHQISTFSWWYILGFIFLALAFLTKGPVVVFLALLVFFPFFWWIGKLDYFLKSKSFWIGFILFFFLALPWFIAVHFATGGEYTKIFFGLHNINRYLTVVSGHRGSLIYFIPVIFIGFLPWTFFIPQAIGFIVRKGLKILLLSPEMQLHWFCFWWFLVIFLFFSFSKTQLLTYILPALVPLSIMVALYLDQLFSNQMKTIGIVIGLGLFFLMCLAAMYLYVFNAETIFPRVIKELGLSMQILICLFILLAGAGMAWAGSARNVIFTVCVTLVTLFILYFFLLTFTLPEVARHSQGLIKTFAQTISEDVEVGTYIIMKPSIIFYLAKKVKRYGNLDSLQQRINQKEKFAFVTQRKFLGDIKLENAYLWGSDSRYVIYTNYKL